MCLLRSPFLRGGLICVCARLAVASRRMQAALRAGVGEIVRGLGTGLIVWAGYAQPSCTCVCAECPAFPRLPDCVCNGSSRSCDCEKGALNFLYYAVVGLILGLCIGYVAGRGGLSILQAASLVAEDLDHAPLSEEAARQLAEIRRRQNGSRQLLDRQV